MLCNSGRNRRAQGRPTHHSIMEQAYRSFKPIPPPDDQDIPQGPPQRNGQPASDARRTAQQTASHPEDTHP
eukprot:3085982-Amphidinium_carterae.1